MARWFIKLVRCRDGDLDRCPEVAKMDTRAAAAAKSLRTGRFSLLVPGSAGIRHILRGSGLEGKDAALNGPSIGQTAPA
jgi:hypothetical protein